MTETLDKSAPPYKGEGDFALWHFSEDRALGRFAPHTPLTNPEMPPLVWAIDTRHSPTYWFPRDCPLYAYRMPSDTFRPDSVTGYWVSNDVVHSIERVDVYDLIDRHVDASIELRVTPTILPFWEQVVDSTLGFSGCRLRFAGAPLDHYDPY